MTSSILDARRRIIPRWRDVRAAATTGELGSLKPRTTPNILDSTEFENSLAEWRANGGIGLAFEVVASALVLGRKAEANSAAKLLVQSASATPLSKALGRILLEEDSVAIAPIESRQEQLPFHRLRIAALRKSLIDFPTNPLLWVELAREYAMLGQSIQSDRAMRCAVTLAPNDRFVLRSASRLFIHHREPDKALELLQASPATLRDPWLLAAHLATSDVASAAVQHVKAARDMVKSGSFSSLQTSELSSAIGSLELSNGSFKQGRRFIGFSLEDPTENSVAQAIYWARKTISIPIKTDLNSVDRSFEARARVSYFSSIWNKVIEACRSWSSDEPFSSRPSILGSFLACSILDDPKIGEEFALQGLRANPGHSMLLNNYAVALAYQGRIDEAKASLAQIPRIDLDLNMRTTLLATEGLLEFRAGNHELGRSLYKDSMAEAGEDEPLRLLALLHFAKEELEADQTLAVPLIREAEELHSRNADPAKAYLLSRLKLKAQLD